MDLDHCCTILSSMIIPRLSYFGNSVNMISFLQSGATCGEADTLVFVGCMNFSGGGEFLCGDETNLLRMSSLLLFK